MLLVSYKLLSNLFAHRVSEKFVKYCILLVVLCVDPHWIMLGVRKADSSVCGRLTYFPLLILLSALYLGDFVHCS